MMSTQLETLKEQRISRAREALQRSRDLRLSRRALGVDGIRQFVKDVDGDWLNDWTDAIDTKNTRVSYTSIEVLILEIFLYLSALNVWSISVLSLNQRLNTNIVTIRTAS